MSTIPQVSGISDFADSYLGAEPGPNLAEAGPACRLVLEALGGQADAATPLIATMFWQAFLRADEFRSCLAEADIDPAAADSAQTIVVAHPLRPGTTPRYDLIVFHPDFHHDEPFAIHLALNSRVLSSGLSRLMPHLERYRKDNSEAPITLLLDNPQILTEALRATTRSVPFGLIVTAPPEVTFTSAPSPAWKVTTEADEGDFATVGVLDENDDGVLGVTVPFHAVTAGRPAVIGGTVMVRGMEGSIVSADPITDSCFVQLPTADPKPGIVTVVSRSTQTNAAIIQETVEDPHVAITGVLSGTTPQQYEDAFFDGALSEATQTLITGWDPDVVLCLPNNQSKLYTQPDTARGDSGAALRDTNGVLLGFAFQRTGFHQVPPFSSWIWAESVVRLHVLRLRRRLTKRFGVLPAPAPP